ncbi:RRP6-like protein 2 [Tanacetum coccineum]
MHGADKGILWLQRDFGIYVCNMFDIGQALRVLKMERNYLDHLLLYFCGSLQTKSIYKPLRRARLSILKKRGMGVEGHANDEKIKLAYGRLANYYHPDGLCFTHSHTNCGSLAKGETAEVGRLLAGSKITSMLAADYMILCGAE